MSLVSKGRGMNPDSVEIFHNKFKFFMYFLIFFSHSACILANIRKRRLTAVGIRCADQVTPLYMQKWLFLQRQAAAALSVQFACALKAKKFDFLYYS
jgi:hypothetical protein